MDKTTDNGKFLAGVNGDDLRASLMSRVPKTPPSTVNELWPLILSFLDLFFDIFVYMDSRIRRLEARLEQVESVEKWRHDYDMRVYSVFVGTSKCYPIAQPGTPGHQDEIKSFAPEPSPAGKLPSEAVEPKLMELPRLFNIVIRSDAHLTNVCVSLLRQLAPQVSGRGRRFARWSHVKRVFEEHQIIPKDASQRDFGRAIADVVPGQGVESVRKACQGYSMSGVSHQGSFHDWADGTSGKNQCLDVEHEMQDLISLLPWEKK